MTVIFTITIITTVLIKYMTIIINYILLSTFVLKHQNKKYLAQIFYITGKLIIITP